MKISMSLPRRRRRSRRGPSSGQSILLAAAAFAASVSASTPSRADDDGMLATPVVRFAIGPVAHLAPEEDQGVHVGLELTAGFSAIMGDTVSGLAINPEAGYTYDSFGLHAFNATFGIGYGSPLLAVAYHPRLILGSAEGNFAIGMRNALGMHGAADIFSAEVGHQFIRSGGAIRHDVSILFGINPGAVVFLVAQISDSLN